MALDKKSQDLIKAIEKFETQLKAKGLMKDGEHVSSLVMGKKSAKKKSEIKHAAAAAPAANVTNERPCVKTRVVTEKIFHPVLKKFITVTKEICVEWG